MGFGSQFDEDNFFRDSAQIGYNLTLGENVTHELHVGFQWFSDRETLIRSSNGWGSLSVPGGRLAPIPGTGKAAYYTATFQQQTTGAGGSDQVRIPVDELRGQRPDPVEERDRQPRRAREQRHAVRPGAAGGLLHAVRVRLRARQQVQDVRDPLREDDPAARRRDLGVQREGHGLRELREVQPVRQLAAPRRLLGPQPDRDLHRRVLRPERRALRRPSPGLLVRQAVRAGHDAAHVRRGPGGHRPGVRTRTCPPGSTAGTARAATSGRTPTTTRESPSTRPPGFPGSCTSRTSAATDSPRSAADRPTSSPISTTPSPGTTKGRWRRSGVATKTFIRGSFTWSHYYGNFDQDDATGGNNDMNTFIGSSNIGDGGGTPALGLQGREPARRPALHDQALRHPPAALERQRRVLLHLSGRAALGDAELRALPEPDDEHERLQPLRRAGRLAANAALTGRSISTTPRTSPCSRTTTSSSPWTSSTSSTSRPATTSSRSVHNSAYGTARNYFNPRRLQVAARFQL